MVGTTKINIPKPPLKRDTDYQKRKHFRRRATIEPIMGHLKQDHWAVINYLKGQIGDSINFKIAAAGFNFRKWMIKLKENILWLIFKIKKWACFKNLNYFHSSSIPSLAT